MNTNEKATLEYRVITAINPKDGTTFLRPLICNKETYDIARALRFCIDNGYVTGGQYFASYGVVNGFLEGIQKLGKDGRDILLNGWLRIHPELRGTIDPATRVLGSDNELHVCVSAQKDLRRKVDDFCWSCVDDTGTLIRVTSISSPDGKKGEVTKNKAIVANGNNLGYHSAWGDSVTVEYDGLSTPITLVPAEKSETYLRFDWPTALSELDDGTLLTFTFKLHAAEGAREQLQQLSAVFTMA